MSSLKYRSILLLAAVVSALGTQLVATAGAASIHGTVVNGTTGGTDVKATVSIINPASGMAPVQTVQAVNGEFSIDNLEPGSYLARVEYAGVTYNRPFQIAGDEHADVTVEVFDTTTSWKGVKVVVPHFTAARHSDHLVIERVYDIYNEAQPLKTITGDEGFFRFPLPEEMHAFNALFVQYGEVPIERQPVESGEKGVYLVDYPIRPGLTRVVMSYTANYDSGAVSMNEKIQYDIDSFTIFATDAEMEISSSSHELAEGGGPHEGVSWEIKGLKRGDVLNLSFRGGVNQETASGGSGEGQHMVIVVPNDAENLSLILMVILLLALVTFVGIAMKEPRIDGAEALRLSQYRDVLIERLAKLDDLRETGAIPAGAYQAKRMELKNQLASLIIRLGEGSRERTQTERSERSHA